LEGKYTDGYLQREGANQPKVEDDDLSYSKRFGIHYVDFNTRKRTRKLSADWYREVILRNTVA